MTECISGILMIEVLYQLYITLIMFKRLSVCSQCLVFNDVYIKEILVNCCIPPLLLSASLYKKLKAFWRISESRTICLYCSSLVGRFCVLRNCLLMMFIRCNAWDYTWNLSFITSFGSQKLTSSDSKLLKSSSCL